MNVLFDHGTPAPLRNHLTGHQISTAFERGWHALKNGVLLQAAETAGVEVLVTTDQSMPRQQNIHRRSIAVVILSTTSWPLIQKRIPEVAAAIASAQPGQFSLLTV